MENWKAVSGFEDLYEVSDQGRVRRLPSVVKNGQGLVRLAGKVVSSTAYKGYQVVNLWRDNRPTRWLVHRLVAATFIGPSELSVDHINGDGLDNRLSNLRYLTLAENTLAQHAAGRAKFVRGEKNGKSRLTEDMVRSAKSMLAEGRSSSDVASEMGVSKGAIQAMRQGRTWSHII